MAGYAYSDNYLIDLKHAVIVDVEATTTIRQAEVSAAKTMLDRAAEQFELATSRLVADAGYGSAEMIEWLVDERGIEPHVKLMDKSERKDGTFSRSDFAYDAERDLYVCRGGKELRKRRCIFSSLRSDATKAGTIIYRASKLACEACALKPKCCPNTPARKIARSIHEAARDKARAIAKTEAYVVSRRRTKEGRDAVRSFEAHPQARPIAPAWPKGSQGRVPVGRRRPKSAEIGEAHRRPYSPHEAKGSNRPPWSSSQPLPALVGRGVLQRNRVSAPTDVASGRTGVRAIAVIPCEREIGLTAGSGH